MTPKEAIRRIKQHNEIHSRKEQHFAVHITEALNMAVDALEKQIPKRPNKIGYPIDSDTDPLVYGYCPCCNTHRDSSKGFCDNCGQSLDWSDTE